jgi:hypothetical protein
MDAKRKLERLFQSARNQPVPQPGDDFAGGVMRAIRHESRAVPIPLLEQLAVLFPRLAVGTALVITVCAAAEYCLSNVQSDLSTSAAEISEQWFFAAK